ncbi:MAG: hypothetical protein CVU00_02230 [Bacteroidetes bacterium HGW-Bacteroidetes-17]|jgi:hypothetical protein|nr:MAG: hypothetical protein CVU00_02230 [Bacteroidetes bacterium HGW-Bacteroidetes-17]
MSKVLFFSPNTSILYWTYPEALLAEALQIEKSEIVYINCGGVFDKYCVSMSAFGLNKDSSYKRKKEICALCDHNKNKIKSTFGLKGYDLKSYYVTEDEQIINQTIQDTTKETYLDFQIDNIYLGRLALFEVLITHKKNNLEFNDDEWREYLIAFKNTLISFYCAKRILAKEKPTSIVTYSSDYSVNHAFCLVGSSLGIPFYDIHAGGNISDAKNNLIISKNYASFFFKELIRFWPNYRNIASNKEALNHITNHFIELFKGLHHDAYSTRKSTKKLNIREKFGIKPSQKVLVATMSSYDERFAGEANGRYRSDLPLLFKTQVEWIKELIEISRKRDDLFLLIRVHPREFPNKRESVRSDHSKLLEQLFINLPNNVKINWPTDNISLYDIACEANVFLNAWSSVGKEMSLFGIPVVIYSADLVNYPASLNYIGSTHDEYINKIDQAIDKGWSFERIRNTYRWYSLEHNYALLDISEGYPDSIKKANKIRRIFLKVIKKMAPYNWFAFVDIDKTYFKKKGTPLHARKLIHELIVGQKNTLLDLIEPESFNNSSLEEETELLKVEIQRLLKTLDPDNIIEGISSKTLIDNLRASINYKDTLETKKEFEQLHL